MAPVPGGAVSWLARHARVRAKSWSSCRFGGCQNLRWMRSRAVLGSRYSYCCSFIWVVS